MCVVALVCLLRLPSLKKIPRADSKCQRVRPQMSPTIAAVLGTYIYALRATVTATAWAGLKLAMIMDVSAREGGLGRGRSCRGPG